MDTTGYKANREKNNRKNQKIGGNYQLFSNFIKHWCVEGLNVIDVRKKISFWQINQQTDKLGQIIYLLLLVALILLLNPYNLHHSITDMDEIWNYQYARRILYGQIPYKDFVMLQTPFSAQLNALFLYIFGDRLIILRWVGSLFWAINGVIAYRILRILGKNHLVAVGYTCVFSSLFLLYPKNNYSWLVLLFLSTALMFELDKIRNDKQEQIYYEIGIGFALGLATITKQNIGMAGLLASIVFLFYHFRYSGKEYLLRSILLKLLGWSVIVGAELLYLYLHTDLVSVIKEIIVNMSQFAGNSSISYLNLFSDNFFVMVLALLVPIIILISLFKGICKKDRTNKAKTVLVSFYALANLTMIIPRADIAHLIFSIPIAIVAGSTLFSNNKHKPKLTSIITVCMLLFTILLVIICNISKQPDQQMDSTIRHYEKIYLPSEVRNRIIKLDQLIISKQATGKIVYFLNYQAEAYLIPLDQFSYKYDNNSADSSGEKELMDLLSSAHNITVIIKSIGTKGNGHENTTVENYVRMNMRYDLSLEGYDVYTN